MVARTDGEFAADGCPNGAGPSGGGVGALPPQTAVQTAAGVSIRRSTCPFMHGSVGAGPFPGYVHGNHPEICKHGCRRVWRREGGRRGRSVPYISQPPDIGEFH